MSTTLATSTSPQRPEVFEVDCETLREPLIKLWQRNLPTASAHRFMWLYQSGHARAWLLGEPGSELAGAAGLMLRRMVVNGRVVDGGAAIDLNVDQSQRSVGPALTLARAVVSGSEAAGCELLFGMPNRSATAVMKRAGYRELGEFSSWTKLLDTRTKLQLIFRSKAMAAMVAPAMNRCLRLANREWLTRLPADVGTESLQRFDSRFDRLWERVRNRFDVVGERTESFLNWRFIQCPDLPYEIFALTQQSTGELLGYVVWFADDGAASISDLMAIDNQMTSVLLAEFSRQMRRKRFSAIRFGCFSSPEFYSQLMAAGFHRRKNRHPVICHASTACSDIASSNARWYLTMADSDTDV